MWVDRVPKGRVPSQASPSAVHVLPVPSKSPPRPGACRCRPPASAGDPPARIVSIGGAVTEILYALGVQDRIVAVDTTSTFPAEAGRSPTSGT